MGAEQCGKHIATSLIRKGAKEVLDRARAAGIVNVNEAPKKSENNANGREVAATSDSSNNGENGTHGKSVIKLDDVIPVIEKESSSSGEPPCKKSKPTT